MRALKSKNQGFTLIETVIVLAISAALAIGLLSSYSVNQRRSRFTDAIERVVTSLERIRQETNSAYTTLDCGPDGICTAADHDLDKIFFGKVVIFSNNNPNYTVTSLTTVRSESVDPGARVGAEGNVTLTAPWGVECWCSGPGDSTPFSRPRFPPSITRPSSRPYGSA